MKRVILLSLILLSFLSATDTSQENKLPRDIGTLFNRAQDFWRLLASNQRLKAMDLVAPDKRELMVGSPQLPFKDARITGIDFTNDPNRALVRVSLKVLVKDMATGYLDSSITDQWVWSKNQWFLDLNNAPLKELFNPKPKVDTAGMDAAKATLEKAFSVSDTTIDLGVIPQGERRRFVVHLNYTNEQPAALSITSLFEGILNDGVPSRLTSSTKDVSLTFVSELWENDFAFPLTVKAVYNGASVERTVTVHGSVFAPISFAQNPSVFVDAPGNILEVKIRNNTQEAVKITSLSTDDAYALARLPTEISAGSEETVHLVRQANDSRSDRVYITFDKPLNGRTQFVFPIRVRPRR